MKHKFARVLKVARNWLGGRKRPTCGLELVAYEAGYADDDYFARNPYPKSSPFHAAWKAGHDDRQDFEMGLI